MSDGVAKKTRPVIRRASIYRVHYGLQKEEEVMAKPLAAPLNETVQAYGRQVAGHMKTDNNKYLGVLQCNNGTLLKPIIKKSQIREIDFYNTVTSSTCEDLVELRRYVPKYFGCRKFTYNGHEQEYLVLEDLAERMIEPCIMDVKIAKKPYVKFPYHNRRYVPKYFGCRKFTYNGHEQEYLVLEDLAERMIEPCIMDVKIGKRTWDPLASEQKIKNEQSKYALCKRQFGFCIPGYQVYRLPAGNLCRYNKDYGKKLHDHMVITALRNFLNGTMMPFCRALVLQFLSELWLIQQWARRQTSVRLYSASLLLAYDATRLRSCCGLSDDTLSKKCRSPRKARRSSLHSLHADAGSNFGGLLGAKGPVYKKVNSVPMTPLTLAQTSFQPPSPVTSPWSDALEKINHNHSFEHNYEDKLSKIKMNYRALLDQLSTDSPTPNPWGTVKIIDFAHAFFNEEEDQTIDENFKEGIDNLVNIFEGFLSETDDQVF